MDEIYEKICLKKIHKFTLMIYSLKKIKLQYLESSKSSDINKFINFNYIISKKSAQIERREYIFQPKSKEVFEFAKGITNILKEIGFVIDMDGKGQYIQKIITDEVETVVISDRKKNSAKVIDYDKLEKIYVEYDENRRGDKDDNGGIISTAYDENGVRVRKLIITEDINANKSKIKNALKAQMIDEKNYKIIINKKTFREPEPDIDVLEAKKTKFIAEGSITKFLLKGVGININANIKDFNSIFYQEQFILFPCVKNDMEKEIINIVSRMILPEIKLNSIDQIWSTILYEITVGFLIFNQKPIISISLNNYKNLYLSLMHDFYKNTIVGHTIFFLDYYMKCFINGGFYPEEFVYNWEKEKNNNKNYLKENFIELKRYLYRQNLKELDYDIILCDKESIDFKYEKDVFQYNLRIFGEMKKLEAFENILFPELSHSVFGEMEIDPIVFNYKEEEYKPIISELSSKEKEQKLLVYSIMNKIPYFQGYFFLLNIITFSIHYLTSLVNRGQFLDLSQSLHHQNKLYIKNLPKIFPPAPTVKKELIKPKISYEKIVDFLSPELKRKLIVLMESNEEEQITMSEELTKSLEKEINMKYRNYLKKLVNDSEEIEIRNNKDLKIEKLLGSFLWIISNINSFRKKFLEEIHQNLLNLQKRVKEELKLIDSNYEGEIEKKNLENINQKIIYIKQLMNIILININNYYSKSSKLENTKLDELKAQELKNLEIKIKKGDYLYIFFNYYEIISNALKEKLIIKK